MEFTPKFSASAYSDLLSGSAPSAPPRASPAAAENAQKASTGWDDLVSGSIYIYKYHISINIGQ